MEKNPRRDSAFIDNTSENKGGGSYLDNYSPATLENVTISGNEAREPTNSGGQGGGFSGNGDNTTLINSIFDRNVAENNGNSWDIKHHTTAELQYGGGNYQWPAKNQRDDSDLNVT